jgi:hypothetical protein
MKIDIHENTGLIYLTSQTSDDLYLLGRIAAKLNGSQSEAADGKGNKRVTLKADDVIKKLAA